MAAHAIGTDQHQRAQRGNGLSADLFAGRRWRRLPVWGLMRSPGSSGGVGENRSGVVVHGVEQVGETWVYRGRIDRPKGILFAQKRGICPAERLRQNVYTSHWSRFLVRPSAVVARVRLSPPSRMGGFMPHRGGV